jgi:SnoaL-like domain
MAMTDLDRLVAIEALRSLQSRYVRYADSKNWQALADLFLPSGTFIACGMDGEPMATLVGCEQIRTVIAASVGAGTATHHLFSYEIDLRSLTDAYGIWAMEDWVDRSDDDSVAEVVGAFRTLHGMGHYHVEYKMVNGEWFISYQTLCRTKLEITY